MPEAKEKGPEAFRNICFVIMPFGTKPVGTGDAKREVDFDRVFEEIFEPAVNAVKLPTDEGGGSLQAVRTDKDFFTGHISHEMFEYIEYSRFALADITGLNANVFYELGARHRAHESGTAIFRQENAPIPFDINQIKAFPYEFEPAERIEGSKAQITKVLSESLIRNAWDSPIMLALRRQRERTLKGVDEIEGLAEVLHEAENAVRDNNLKRASELWAEAATLDPDNPLHNLKSSYWAKSQGDWNAAIGLLQLALAKEAKFGKQQEESTYADAYRELGIAQNKRDKKIFARAGEESLRKAVYYNPEDYDAWSSLGGVLKRANDEAGALECYERAIEVSDGHPYPLLNAIKLRAKQTGRLKLDPQAMLMLGKAEGFRKAQVENEPPIDVPWSFFDLAEIKLYTGDSPAALDVAARGLKLSTSEWMPGTFLSSLELLPEDESLESLAELRSMARVRYEELVGE